MLAFLGRGAASENGSLLKHSEKAAAQAPAATTWRRGVKGMVKGNSLLWAITLKGPLSPAKAGAPPEWEPIKWKSGGSRTIESLALLRERWHAKRDGEGFGRVQAKRARFEYFQSSHKSARCDVVDGEGNLKEASPYEGGSTERVKTFSKTIAFYLKMCYTNYAKQVLCPK